MKSFHTKNEWEIKTRLFYGGREDIAMAKHTKKDGGTKQKGKNKPKNKTSSSANGQNGYH